MATVVIRDRGRGPEIEGTRITIYHLLPYFLDPTATEEYIGRVHGLNTDQVAAARAYVLNNPDTVLAEHLKIEERIAEGNPLQVILQAKQTHERFVLFKEWLDRRREAETGGLSVIEPFPTFKEWVEQTNSPPIESP